MAKQRLNRLPPIEHQQRQIEFIKDMTPNTTPEHYRALSNGLADVSVQALELMAALEADRHPNFKRLYNLVDKLADLVDESDEAEEPSTERDTKSLVDNPESTTEPINDSVQPVTGGALVKSTIVGRPERIVVDDETVTLYLTYTPQPNANGQFTFPKGVPAPQQTPTPVVVYVGKKQFDKVKAQLEDPADALIIECSITQVLNGVLTAYANTTTSRVLKIQQQKAVAAQTTG